MRRYVGKRAEARPGKARRYIRPYMRLEERVTSVDVVLLPRRQEKMIGKNIRAFLGRHGNVSLILRPSILKPGPATVSVLHIVVDPSGRLKHYGLKGLRGWSLNDLDKIELPVEFDLILGRPVKHKKPKNNIDKWPRPGEAAGGTRGAG